jgi:hypothetical protein
MATSTRRKGPLTAKEIKKLRKVRDKLVKKGKLRKAEFRDPVPAELRDPVPAELREVAPQKNPVLRNASGKAWKNLEVGEDTPPPWEIDSAFRRFRN